MKANIKLSFYLPIIVTVITIVVTILSFDYFNLIFIAGALYIDAYYLASYFNRIDALIITNQDITVTTAFKTRNYVISELSGIKYTDGENSIRAIYDNKNVTICNNIYSNSLQEIYNFLTRETNKEAILD
jgi:hypothetical protein